MHSTHTITNEGIRQIVSESTLYPWLITHARRASKAIAEYLISSYSDHDCSSMHIYGGTPLVASFVFKTLVSVAVDAVKALEALPELLPQVMDRKLE